jgi:hypothetical protein
MVTVIFKEFNNGQDVVSKGMSHGQATDLLRLVKEADNVYIEDNQYKYNCSSLGLATETNDVDLLLIYVEEEKC